MAAGKTSELLFRMKFTFLRSLRGWWLFTFLAGVLSIGNAVDANAAEIKKGDIRRFETLSLHDETYTNAVVEGVSTNVVFIRHDRGIAVVKIKDLTFEEAKTLGIESMLPPPPAPRPDPAKALNEQWQKVMAMITGVAGAGVGLAILAAIPVFWILWCYLLKRMCTRAGTESGFLIWLPLLQLVPLHKAAHISCFLILGYFLPVVGVIVFVYWAIKMCEAVGKTKWLAVPMVLPFLNVLTIAYLAFSKED